MEDVMEECPICGLSCEDIEFHKRTNIHLFNMVLYKWVNLRKRVVKDRHGINVNVDSENHKIIRDSNRGIFKTYLIDCSQNELETVIYKFEVCNNRKSPIILYKVILLHPYPAFELEDPQDLMSNKAIRLLPGATYNVMLTFKGNAVGGYSMPIAFMFQTEDAQDFNIIKEMKVIIGDSNAPTEFDEKSSPFTDTSWKDIKKIFSSTTGRAEQYSYIIPEEYKKCYKKNLIIHQDSNAQYIETLNTIKDDMDPGNPTELNYSQFFHHILWIEELTQLYMVKRYNMENVTMTVKSDVLQLTVPGLAENRPSLIIGDKISIRLHESVEVYKGEITQIHNEDIWISGIQQKLFILLNDNPDLLLDVKFDLSRLSFERMHRAVELCMSRELMKSVFPHSDLSLRINKEPRIKILDKDYFNKNIVNNEQQKLAVTHIINGSSKPVPYIVFGPPGTGKTITIVEAILQIINRSKKCVVLVCAPSNAACDMLTLKLKQFLKKDQLIRVSSCTRSVDSLPEEIKPYSNYNASDKSFFVVTPEKLMNFRVIVCTLISAGRYVNTTFVPTHVFIDEAGQAKEPETLVPIAGIISLDGQIVLAGDPQQLGPICHSDLAQKYGHGISLLERLMISYPIYQNYNNANFITKLKLNFRSHPDILKIPNELFYEGELQPVSDGAKNDILAKINFWNKFKRNSSAIEFHSVVGQESREGRSPSYYNLFEIKVINKYLDAIFSPKNSVKIECNDIGIITPYMRQVYRIKQILKTNGWDKIEVGTVEAFQGREKRLIIISTVRAKESLLLYDKFYKLGFLNDKKRFNVAITRAKSKLIVIGNPHCLMYDKQWLTYIEECQGLSSFRGSPIVYRDEMIRQDIIDRFENITFEDVQYAKNKENNKKR